MPAGPEPLGFAYFLAAKLAGYTAFCHWGIRPNLERMGWMPRRSSASALPVSSPSEIPAPLSGRPQVPSSVKAGVIRTLIGVTVGALVGLSFWGIPYFSTHGEMGTVLFFTLLVPVRVGEWGLLLWWVYRLKLFSNLSCIKLITFGLLVSFALDALGIITALVLPGGMWVC